MGHGLLFLSGELDTFGNWSIYFGCTYFLVNWLSQKHLLALRQEPFCEFDLSLTVVKGQISGKRYHSDRINGTL